MHVGLPVSEALKKKTSCIQFIKNVLSITTMGYNHS